MQAATPPNQRLRPEELPAAGQAYAGGNHASPYALHYTSQVTGLNALSVHTSRLFLYTHPIQSVNVQNGLVTVCAKCIYCLSKCDLYGPLTIAYPKHGGAQGQVGVQQSDSQPLFLTLALACCSQHRLLSF